MLENGIQVVACTVEDEEYAIEIKRVQEIIRVIDITRVPYASAFISGVINLRGKVIPVMDLRKRFGLPSKAPEETARIVVINWNNDMVGVLVDSVSEVVWLPAQSVGPPPSSRNGGNTEFFSGIGKLGNRLLIMLNLETIFEVNDSASAGRGM
ncbi:chemotaxis protein CheW [Phosphitispora sp. TUW77]|uniref:chemotaxis protein CheW n=1 Tax=Phosphitispora sp. TUW77 TaxID=3152361 RepID=UPI003AB39538